MISSKELFKAVFLGSNKNFRADDTLARKVVVVLKDNILQKKSGFLSYFEVEENITWK